MRAGKSLVSQAIIISVVCLGVLSSPIRSWATDGIALWDSERLELPVPAGNRDTRTISDGSGGAIVFWYEYDGMHAQRLDQTGAYRWGSESGGILIDPGYELDTIVSDGHGGALLARVDEGELRVQRISSNGWRAWDPDGVLFHEVTVDPDTWTYLHIAPDGHGGAFLAWQTRTRDDGLLEITHIDEAGALPPPSSRVRVLSQYSDSVVTASDEQGTAYIAWTEKAPGAFPNIRLQRLTSAPAFSLPWGSTPVKVTDDNKVESDLSMVVDEQGAALISFLSKAYSAPDQQVRVQRIDNTGNAHFFAHGTVVVDLLLTAHQWGIRKPTVASDGARGAFVAWPDNRNWTGGTPGDIDVYVQHINALGSAQWTHGGIPMPTPCSYPSSIGTQVDPRIFSDGEGGAVLVYVDSGAWNDDITATRLGSDGTVLWTDYVFWDRYVNDEPGVNQALRDACFDLSGPGPDGVIVTWRDGGERKVYAQKMQVADDPPRAGNDVCPNPTPIDEGLHQGDSWGATDVLPVPPWLPPDVRELLERALPFYAYDTADVWFEFTAPRAGTLWLNTLGSSYDTILSVHSDCPEFIEGAGRSTPDGHWDYHELAFDDHAVNRIGHRRPYGYLSLDVQEDQRILIRLAAANPGDWGNYTLRVSMGAQPYSGCIDDQYEPNDNAPSAYDLTAGLSGQLSSVEGWGIALGDDWYKVQVEAGQNTLHLHCQFDQAAGDIDMALYDAGGHLLDESVSSYQQEEILVEGLVPGEYFVHVYPYGVPSCIPYDLFWETSLEDDAYEENDTAAQAFDLSSYDNVGIEAARGLAIMAPGDEDWYRFEAGPEDQKLAIVCYFEHEQGDIDLVLYDAALNPVDYSNGYTGTERIDVDPLVQGTYYIRVMLHNDGKPGGNEYNLAWGAACRDDDAYEQNDTPETAYDLSGHPQTWLSSINGLATMGDAVDYYSISLTAPDHLRVRCQFDASEGDLYVVLLDDDNQPVALAEPTATGSEIDLEAIEPGLYRLAVVPYGDAMCSAYDLYWEGDCSDDVYEPNNSLAEAHDLTSLDLRPSDFVALGGVVRHGDDDWYKISVDKPNARLELDCSFSIPHVDIDLYLYDEAGNPIDASASYTEEESIAVSGLPQGIYYVQVSLWASDIPGCPEYGLQIAMPCSLNDPYEPNNAPAEAHDLGDQQITPLSALDGRAVMDDTQDFYRIQVQDAGTFQLTCEFEHADGCLQVALLDDEGNTIAGSVCVDEGGQILCALAEAGTYILRVTPDGGAQCMPYDLQWTCASDPNIEPVQAGHIELSIMGTELTVLLTDLPEQLLALQYCTDLEADQWLSVTSFVPTLENETLVFQLDPALEHAYLRVVCLTCPAN